MKNQCEIDKLRRRFFKIYLLAKPTYITHKIIDKDYAAIHEIKPV